MLRVARLAGIGALAGAGIALGVPTGLALISGAAPTLGVLWPIAATLGAALGALLLPVVVVCGALGHVPLRRVLRATGLGTVVGTSVGLLDLLGTGGELVVAPLTAVAGFLVAAGLLRWRCPRRTAAPPAVDAA